MEKIKDKNTKNMKKMNNNLILFFYNKDNYNIILIIAFLHFLCSNVVTII